MSHNFYIDDPIPNDQEPVLVFIPQYPNNGLRCHFDLATLAFHVNATQIIIPYANIVFWLPDFDPLALPGMQLYLTEHYAKVSSWLDLSPNAFDFAQAVPAKQPSISANSVDYDGITQYQEEIIADPLNDASGIMFFSGYYDNVQNNILFSSADNSSEFKYCMFQVENVNNRLRLLFHNGVTSNNITSTNSIVNGAYFYGYIKSDGANYFMNLNGVNEVLIVVSGANNGRWFSGTTGRINLSIGRLSRLTPAVAVARVNKQLYSNAALTPTEITNALFFMSKPTNF